MSDKVKVEFEVSIDDAVALMAMHEILLMAKGELDRECSVRTAHEARYLTETLAFMLPEIIREGNEDTGLFVQALLDALGVWRNNHK